MVQFCSRGIAVTAACAAFFVATLASAQEQSRERSTRDEAPAIFDVRKSLPMEPTEKAYHDFYINAGSEAGFKRGQFLPIRRSLPVHDPIQNKQQAVLTVPVGNVVVIHVDRGLTVARLVQELGNEDRPTLEFEAIMIGDHVDMKGITTTPPKEAGKKKTTHATVTTTEIAESSAGVEQPTATVAPVLAPAAPSAPAASPTTVANSVQAPVGAPKVDAGGVKTHGTEPKADSQRVTQPLPPPTA